MVPYSLKGPRARGGMSPKQRDSYSNHILLCPTCHTIVDTNKDDYPLKVLRRFKTHHESWVAESLRAHSSHVGPSAEFYQRLLERLEGLLHLPKWPWLIDHLWRDLFPDSVLLDAGGIARIVATTLWPGTRPKLEKTLKAVMAAWLKYCQHFETFCQPSRSGDFVVRERAYDNALGHVVHDFDVRADKWSRRNRDLLRDYVATLNKMVDAVRDELNTSYREDRGYFPLLDVTLRGSDGSWIVVPKEISSELTTRRTSSDHRLNGGRQAGRRREVRSKR